MKTYSFLRLDNGHFNPGNVTVTRSKHLAKVTPSGCVAIEGEFDYLSCRVDLSVYAELEAHRAAEHADAAAAAAIEAELLSRLVVEYQPPTPEPAEHYEWSATIKRWVKRAEIAAAERASAQARAEIQRLEVQQLRPMRELQLDPNNTDAIMRLDAINTRIAELRPRLNR